MPQNYIKLLSALFAVTSIFLPNVVNAARESFDASLLNIRQIKNKGIILTPTPGSTLKIDEKRGIANLSESYCSATLPTIKTTGEPLTIDLFYTPNLMHYWLWLDGRVLTLKNQQGKTVLTVDIVRRGRLRLGYGNDGQVSFPLQQTTETLPLKVIIDNNGARLEALGRSWATVKGTALQAGNYQIILAQSDKNHLGARGWYSHITVTKGAENALPSVDYASKGDFYRRLSELDRKLITGNEDHTAVPETTFSIATARKAAARCVIDSLWHRLYLNKIQHFDEYFNDLAKSVDTINSGNPETERWNLPASPAGTRFLSPEDREFHFGVIGWELGCYAPEMAKLGYNIVSDSVWPNIVMNPDGRFNAERMTQRILPSVEELSRYGIKIDMLVAAYSPDYLIQKHPEWNGVFFGYGLGEKEQAAMIKENKEWKGRIAGHGFLKASIIHSDYLEMCRNYLVPLFSYLKKNPAIVATCLLNEPQFEDYSPAMQIRFHNYLKKQYPSLDALNKLWKSSYANWDEIFINRVNAYDRHNIFRFWDWLRFNREVGTEYLNFLNAIAKQNAPNLRTHAKTLPWEFGLQWYAPNSDERNNYDYADGVDRLEFNKITDFTGTDSWADRFTGDSELSTNTIYQSMYYDLVGFYDRKKPIFDTEWHIVSDMPPRTPPRYLDMVMQLNVAHQLRAGTIWVMSPSPNELDISSDMPLLLQSGLTAARIRANQEIYNAIATRPREIALLYSVKNRHINGDKSIIALQNLYKAGLFSGLGIRMLDERQLISGDYSGIKILISIDCPVPEEQTVEAVKRFCNSGGFFYAIGDFGSKNNTWTDGKTVQNVKSLPSTDKYETLQQIITSAAAVAEIYTPVKISGKNGQSIFGVEWHVASNAENKKVVFAANYSRKPQTIKITGVKKIRNVITGKPVNHEMSLDIWETFVGIEE